MTTHTGPGDPLDIVPDVIEIQQRLGATYRTARILRGLLRIAEQRRDHENLSDSSKVDGSKSPISRETNPCN